MSDHLALRQKWYRLDMNGHSYKEGYWWDEIRIVITRHIPHIPRLSVTHYRPTMDGVGPDPIVRRAFTWHGIWKRP